MSSFRYADRAARLLRGARARIRPYATIPAEDTIALLADAIVAAAARRRRREIRVAVTAAAAILGLVTAGVASHRARLLSKPATTLADADLNVSRGGPARHGTGDWTVGQRVRGDILPIELTAKDGTTVEIEPHSDLEVLRADSERWLRLAAGAVSVHVAKLKPGERFVMVTPDAEVEVRGTRFHVAVVLPVTGCGNRTATRVVVDDGVVTVRSAGEESRVEAGERWPSPCSEPDPGSARRSSNVHSIADSVRGAARGSIASTIAATDQARAPSTLAAENDLFIAALKAERAGDGREALQLLDVLISRFPKSPLKASALEVRERLTNQ